MLTLPHLPHLQQALHMAYLSKMAYSDTPVIPIYLNDAKITTLDVEETQCLILERDTEIDISFRGTESDKIQDWLTDLDLDLIPSPTMGLTHEGFSNALDLVYDDIAEVVANAGNRKVNIGGHSLGGALATICAARLSRDGLIIHQGFTFGSPRVGNWEFVRSLTSVVTFYRFVNNNDIVTRIPPRVLGYHHAGLTRYFMESGELTTKINGWRAFLDRVSGRIDDILEWGTDGIKDHSVDNYVLLLENEIARFLEGHESTKVNVDAGLIGLIPKR